jgi:hypothetical protein
VRPSSIRRGKRPVFGALLSAAIGFGVCWATMGVQLLGGPSDDLVAGAVNELVISFLGIAVSGVLCGIVGSVWGARPGAFVGGDLGVILAFAAWVGASLTLGAVLVVVLVTVPFALGFVITSALLQEPSDPT